MNTTGTLPLLWHSGKRRRKKLSFVIFLLVQHTTSKDKDTHTNIQIIPHRTNSHTHKHSDNTTQNKQSHTHSDNTTQNKQSHTNIQIIPHRTHTHIIPNTEQSHTQTFK